PNSQSCSVIPDAKSGGFEGTHQRFNKIFSVLACIRNECIPLLSNSGSIDFLHSSFIQRPFISSYSEVTTDSSKRAIYSTPDCRRNTGVDALWLISSERLPHRLYKK